MRAPSQGPQGLAEGKREILGLFLTPRETRAESDSAYRCVGATAERSPAVIPEKAEKILKILCSKISELREDREIAARIPPQGC